MGFKDIRAMTVISDRLEDLHCKLYGFLESASIETAKRYSKDELEVAEIFARAISDKIYLSVDGFPDIKLALCIDMNPDEFMDKIVRSKPRDFNKVITSTTKGDENEKVHSEGSSDSYLHMDPSGEKRAADEAESPKVK